MTGLSLDARVSSTAPQITSSPAVRRVEAVSRRVQQPASTGDLISLAVGEPDFPTPERIVVAANEAMQSGWTHYAPLKGAQDLRAALAERLSPLLGGYADPSDVLVTHGASAGLAATILGLVGPGDKVVLPDPTYSLYADLVALAGGRTVHVPLAEDLHWDLNALIDALDGARLFVFCNPSNPTGIVHTREELTAVGQALAGTDTLLVADEAYADLVFDRTFVSALEVDELRERTIYCQTFSKSYAMTGWRLGYLWGPAAAMKAAARVHATFNGSPNTFVQRAGLVALTECADDVEHMQRVYSRRKEVMFDALRAVPGLTVRPPEGAFYLFPKYEVEADSVDVVAFLRGYGVAVRPGAEFGSNGEGHLRLSFAADEQDIVRGVARLADGLAAMVNSGDKTS